jgi:hypothetical protein
MMNPENLRHWSSKSERALLESFDDARWCDFVTPGAGHVPFLPSEPPPERQPKPQPLTPVVEIGCGAHTLAITHELLRRTCDALTQLDLAIAAITAITAI